MHALFGRFCFAVSKSLKHSDYFLSANNMDPHYKLLPMLENPKTQLIIFVLGGWFELTGSYIIHCAGGV